jgi:tetratricopeptide (TPR) repeat protein
MGLGYLAVIYSNHCRFEALARSNSQINKTYNTGGTVMALHVFVVMPFGIKGGIDFDKVYSDYIKPALEGEGYEVFRADEERCGGNILEDMFQELLLADLVIADLSIDNPNVWYELGVRHALRSSGTVSKREYQPFDLAPVRKCNYNIKNGLPDPACIEQDKAALATMAKMTMATWHGHRISPVLHMLPYLQEPEWKLLRVGNVRKFWQKHDAWEMCIKIAEQKRHPGDIIVLAKEAPVQVFQLEAYRTAGKFLVKLGQYAFALEQYKKALTIDSEDLESKHQTGIILGRLQKYAEARIHLEKLVKDNPGDADQLGRDELLTYLRYNVKFDEQWLQQNFKKGFNKAKVKELEEMDNSANIGELADAGQKAAKVQVSDRHFPRSFDCSLH